MKKMLKKTEFENPLSERKKSFHPAVNIKISKKNEKDFERKKNYDLPLKKIKKVDIHIKLDKDLIEWVQQPQKKGYQTRINEILRCAKSSGFSIFKKK